VYDNLLPPVIPIAVPPDMPYIAIEFPILIVPVIPTGVPPEIP
jgi:hypothetical protein